MDSSQTLIKLLRQDSQGHSKEELLHRRKEEYRERMMCGEATEHERPRRKRKFVDRMTLSEAAVEDFDNSQDYVNFLQDKLQGIKIKLIN